MKVHLPAHEDCTTPCVNKNKNNSFYLTAPSEFRPPVVKNEVLTLFQGPLSKQD